MGEGTNNFGISVMVDASGSTEGSRTFQRSAQDIANSAKQATDGAKNLNTELKNIGGSAVKEALESIKGSLEGLNTALKALGIGAVIIEFKELFEVGKELEDALIHLQVASGQTEEVMRQLKESTVSLSNAFGQSQINVVGAQITAAKAGFADLNENTKVTTASLELAKIGFSDVGTAAKTLTEVMQAYGAKADNARSVSESLFVATRKGNLDLAQIGQVFERIAPSAQAAGLSINQVLATLRALGTVESPQRAVLGITQLLRDISEPSETAKNAFERISASLAKVGIQAATFKELVNQQGFIKALQSISDVTGGNQELLSKALGNPQAGVTAYALLNQAAKSYADTLSELADKESTAAAAANKVTESTSFQAEAFRQRIQNSFIGLAATLLENFTPVLHFLNTSFEDLALVGELLAAALGGRLVAAALKSAAAFVAEQIAAINLSIANKAVAVSAAEAAAGVDAMGVAALTTSAALLEVTGVETAMAAATDVLSVALKALGGWIPLLIGLLAAAAVAWLHYGDAVKSAQKDTDNLKVNLDNLHSLGATLPDDLTTSAAARAKKDKESLEKEIQGLTSRKDTDAAGGTGEFGESIFSEKDEDRLQAAITALSKLNGQLERHHNLVNLGTTERFDPGAITTPEFTDASYNNTPLTHEGELAQNDALQKAYSNTFTIVSNLTKATAALKLIQGTPVDRQGDKTVGTTPLAAPGQRLAEQSLQAERISSIDALGKYDRALTTLVASYDPVTAAQDKNANSLRLLKNAQETVTGSRQLGADLLLKVNTAEAESLATANAKVQANVAINDSQKAYANTAAAQTIRQLELNKAFTDGTISPKAYAAAVADVAVQLNKAALSTQALSSGQLKLAQATLALKEAQEKVNNSTGSDEEKAKFLAEARVAQDDANRSTDALADRVEKLAGTYTPLLAIQKKYADQLDEINSLQRARPDLAPQLETAKTLAPLQQKQEVDKSLTLPTLDKDALAAVDDYNLSVAKLSIELQQGQINQTQFNQAVLESKQKFDAAKAAFNDFSKAVQEGGKVMGDALQKYLTNPAQGLRGLFFDIAKGLQASAAALVTKQLESKAFSALASSGNDTIASLGRNLATGTGSKLVAGAGGSGANVGLTTAGTTLATAGTALDTAGVTLSSAAAELSAAAASLSSGSAAGAAGGGGGGSGLGGIIGDLFGGGGGAAASSSTGISAASFADVGFGAALGGTRSPGQSFMVGERGPEVVTAGQHGATITPNDQVRQAVGAAAGNKSSTVVPAPHVSVPVQVVNVSDPKDVPTAMSSPDGHKAIQNYLSQNRGTVKNLLGA